MKQLDAEILDELEAWFAQREQNEDERNSVREELPLRLGRTRRTPENLRSRA